MHLTNDNFPIVNLNSLIDGTVSEFVKQHFKQRTISVNGSRRTSILSIRLVEVKPYGKKSGRTMFINTTSKSIYDFVNMKIFSTLQAIPSYLTGDGSLTVFQILSEWNNPNVKIKKQFERNGTFGEHRLV
jgi:hypothetical protein